MHCLICKTRQLERAKVVIIAGIRLGLLPDVVSYNILIDAYCRIFSINAAYSILHRMKEPRISPDVITFNCLLVDLFFINYIICN